MPSGTLRSATMQTCTQALCGGGACDAQSPESIPGSFQPNIRIAELGRANESVRARANHNAQSYVVPAARRLDAEVRNGKRRRTGQGPGGEGVVPQGRAGLFQVLQKWPVPKPAVRTVLPAFGAGGYLPPASTTCTGFGVTDVARGGGRLPGRRVEPGWGNSLLDKERRWYDGQSRSRASNPFVSLYRQKALDLLPGSKSLSRESRATGRRKSHRLCTRALRH